MKKNDIEQELDIDAVKCTINNFIDDLGEVYQQSTDKENIRMFLADTSENQMEGLKAYNEDLNIYNEDKYEFTEEEFAIIYQGLIAICTVRLLFDIKITEWMV